MKLRELAAATLVAALAFGSQPAFAQSAPVVDRAAIDQALGAKVQSDESARDSVRTLLGRDDIKAMAEGMGLDIRRATNAVSSLEGADLQRVSVQATAANDLLAGGRTTITISLVALLLIIIIIILVTN
ncbi:MAG: hypothetical protein ABI565_10100 [Vicinamibacteria bacterium]